MKEIFISKDNKYNQKETELAVNELEEIDLTKDGVICVPSIDLDENPNLLEVEFNGYGFNLYNAFNLRLSKNYNFEFIPRVRLCIPNGLKLEVKSLIPGINCVQSNYDCLQGIILKDYQIIPNLNNLIFYANECDYQFYNKCEFILKEYDRDLFIKYSQTEFNTTTRININTPIIHFDFLTTFIGNGYNPKYNEIYIIHSDYIYSNLPDLGGFK